MFTNFQISARAGIAGVIDPDAYAAGTYTTDWIDMRTWFWLMAVIMAGDMSANGTIDAKIEQATTNTGTGAKDIVGLAIAQLTKAGSDDNKQALINIGTEDLDFNNGYRFVRLSLTVATAASDAGAIVIGMDPRYGMPGGNDVASVDETVS
ncbi:hypothetical protein [Novosphingobium kaempferiae]|uniref:hypothetical protein n=1 Tax=Novosphingobium kaempferiae TaxID=2896849 RepID=UPI001E2B2579|nr:hypothetical protein [Novosphingobium kaempferiae]